MLKFNSCKMLKHFIKNKLLWSLKNLTKEFSLSCRNSQKKIKMMMLDFSRKLKTRSKSLVLSFKRSQSSRLKGMLTCKTLDSLTKNFLLIHNSTAFWKIEKQFQERFLQSRRSQDRRKAGKKPRSMDSFVQRIKKLIKNRMNKGSTKETERILEILIRRFKSFQQKLILSQLEMMMMTTVVTVCIIFSNLSFAQVYLCATKLLCSWRKGRFSIFKNDF